MTWMEYLHTLGWDGNNKLGEFSYDIVRKRNGVKLVLKEKRLPRLELEFTDHNITGSIWLEDVLTLPIHLRISHMEGVLMKDRYTNSRLPRLFNLLLDKDWYFVKYEGQLNVIGISNGTYFIPLRRA